MQLPGSPMFDMPIKRSDNERMIAVPSNLIGTGQSLDFYLHWVDNLSMLNHIHDFFGAGDNAPNRRGNCTYS